MIGIEYKIIIKKDLFAIFLRIKKSCIKYKSNKNKREVKLYNMEESRTDRRLLNVYISI